MKKWLSIFIIPLIMPSLMIGQGFGYKMITIQTEPSGAELFLNGTPIGKSPATARVQDGLLAPQYTVRAELAGYQKAFYYLDQHWKPGMACSGACCGMIFLPGFVLLIFAKEHEPEYTFYLQKIN